MSYLDYFQIKIAEAKRDSFIYAIGKYIDINDLKYIISKYELNAMTLGYLFLDDASSCAKKDKLEISERSLDASVLSKVDDWMHRWNSGEFETVECFDKALAENKGWPICYAKKIRKIWGIDKFETTPLQQKIIIFLKDASTWVAMRHIQASCKEGNYVKVRGDVNGLIDVGLVESCGKTSGTYYRIAGCE